MNTSPVAPAHRVGSPAATDWPGAADLPAPLDRALADLFRAGTLTPVQAEAATAAREAYAHPAAVTGAVISATALVFLIAGDTLGPALAFLVAGLVLLGGVVVIILQRRRARAAARAPERSRT